MTALRSKSSSDAPRGVLRREGEIYRESYSILEEGLVTQVSSPLLNAKYGIDGVIRILHREYEDIDRTLSLYTHFNLEYCGHQVGATYGLPRVLTQGYFKSPLDEAPPILSFDGMLIGTCVHVQEHVPYSALTPLDFEHAMRSLCSPEAVQRAIVERYSVSMPLLSPEEIIARGVAVTTLRFVR